jgi:hypothetical protein
MTADDLRAWQSSMRLTNISAAKMLGVSKGTYSSYRNSSSDLPKMLELACSALTSELNAPRPEATSSVLRFGLRIKTSEGWQYLSKFGDWTSTTIHTTLRRRLHPSHLTHDIRNARYWTRRGRLTAHDNVKDALRTRFSVQSVAVRWSAEEAVIYQISDVE